MITVAEADRILSRNGKLFSAVKVPLQDALGKILREDIRADRDIPPFNRVMMDGIALCGVVLGRRQRKFLIQGVQKPVGIRPSNCLENYYAFRL